MKNYRTLKAGILILAVSVLASCGRSARIEAVIAGADSAEIVIRQQNVSRYNVLDTVKTGADGKFTYKVTLEKGDPDFIYLYYKNVKLASLLLEAGDKVKVSADTLGNFSVEGSEECAKLLAVEKDYAAFTHKIDSLASLEDQDVRKEIASEYTSYYRKSIRYVMENSKSLTVVPVFYQTFANSFYVFSQDTDAIIFRNICDSLQTIYPDSKYVKSLRQEAQRRSSSMELNMRLKEAESIPYPELELPDVTGKKIKLTDVKSKVILIHFWTSSDAEQKMYNLDVLKDVYAQYHSKGLEIYQVAIDVDKPSWSRVVAAQGLDWINVCDGLGTASPAIKAYNVSNLPVSYLIADGKLVDVQVTDEASFRKTLDRLLK